MASENETVKAAIDAVRKMIHDCPAIKGGTCEFEYQLKANGAIDRIEAAYKREVEKLHKCIEQAINGCAGCQDVGMCGSPLPFKECKRKVEWRKVLEGADECVKNRDPQLERIIRDAVISYNEMFPTAPNSDCENELRERAKVANGWLKDHGFNEETFFFDKPKEVLI